MTLDPLAYLTDWTRCPDCGQPLIGSSCGNCALTVTGDQGARLANLSIAAAAASRAGSSAVSRLLKERSALVRQMRGTAPVPRQAAGPLEETSGQDSARTQLGGTERVGPSLALPEPPRHPVPHPRQWLAPGPVAGYGPPVKGGPAFSPMPPGHPGPNPPHWLPPVPAGGPTRSPEAVPVMVKPPSQWTPTTVLALFGALLVAASALGYAFFIPGLGLEARIAALVAAALAAAGGAVFLRHHKITATSEAMASVAAALALLTWAIAVVQDSGGTAWAISAAFSLLVLAAIVYLAGRRGPRAWRVAGLLMAPFAALFCGPAAVGWENGWTAIGFVCFALIAALGRWVDRGHGERLALELMGGFALASTALLVVSSAELSQDWIIWLLVASAALALGQEHRIGWAPVTGVALVFSGMALAQELTAGPEWGPQSRFGGLAVWAVIALALWRVSHGDVLGGSPVSHRVRPRGSPRGKARFIHRSSGLPVELAAPSQSVAAVSSERVGRALAGGALAGLLVIALPDLLAATGAMLLGVPRLFGLTPASAVALMVPAVALALTALLRQPRSIRRVGYWGIVPTGAACLADWIALPSTPEWLVLAALATLSLALSAGAAGAVMAPGRRPQFSRAVARTGRASALVLLFPACVLASGNDAVTVAAALIVPAAVLAAGFSFAPRSWPILTAVACLPFIVLGTITVVRYFYPTNPGHAMAAVFGLAVAALTLSKRPALPSWAVLATVAAGFGVFSACDLVLWRTWSGTAATFSLTALALAVALVRRRHLPLGLKAAGAATAVAGTAVTLVALLALLTPGSGSVWLFPLVAVVAGTAAMGGLWLRRDGAGRARLVVGATLIASAGGLGLMAVMMSVAWPFAGATTVLATAAILAAASAGVAISRVGTGQAWWYSGAMGCAVLWSALVWGDVGLVEAYTMPPAVAAAVIGGWLARRRRDMLALAIPGFWLAAVPTLVLLMAGDDPLIRSVELAAAGVLCLTLASAFNHLRRTLAMVALAPALGLTTLAVMVGQAPPFGLGLEIFRPLRPYPTVLFALACLIGFAAAAILVAAGRLATYPPAADEWDSSGQTGLPSAPDHWSRSHGWQWWILGALSLAAFTPICSMRFTWPVVAAMWLAMAACLALMLVSARGRALTDRAESDRAESDPSTAASGNLGRTMSRLVLPPFWSIWLVAVAVGIAGWSTRQLRVEVFALPLGLALFAAGLIARRWLGSAAWAVTPGVAATLGPSTLAVGTDPMTWRAIMVLVLALAFMVMGSIRSWRPATWTAAGSMALTLTLVFVQRADVDQIPWLAALVVVGGCLLALAVVFEARSRRAHPKDDPPLGAPEV
ncbi:MAG: hypothetical protein LBG11_09235, partial [Bifidobacteriaceae bacterium]|nr:hypothetical protein [Bifidobacteriaceae bacterium]